MSAIDELAADLRAARVQRIHVLAWRDLDDPDAGGSEVHADEVLRRWAAAGLDVVLRTSAAGELPARSERHGYDVIRRGSRYTVFPRAGFAEVFGRMGRSDALVEVWNGVPWFSPVWYRRPRVTIIHHVHGPMWDQMMPQPLAAMGRALEARIAPVVYRHGATVTPSESTREELLELGFDARRVTAVPNGVEERFTPGGERSPTPLVLAVGRFAPVKRFHLALRAAALARREVPDLRLRLVGDGPLAGELRTWVTEHRASRVGRVRRLRRARPTARRVPARLGRAQRVTRRGVGALADRGRGVRDARGRHGHPRPPLLGGRREDRAARRAGTSRWRPGHRARRRGAARTPGVGGGDQSTHA